MTSYRGSLFPIADYSPKEAHDRAMKLILGDNPTPESRKRLERVIEARRAMRASKCGSFVYYIKLADRIKIGTSTNLKHRLRELPWDSVQLLEVGDTHEERLRHEQFAHLRIQGEWFKESPELTRFIECRRQELCTQQLEWYPSAGPLPWGMDVEVDDSKAIQVRFMRRYLGIE